MRVFDVGMDFYHRIEGSVFLSDFFETEISRVSVSEDGVVLEVMIP